MSFYFYLNFTLSQSLTSLFKETANVRCHICQNEPSLVTHNNEAVWLYTYKQSLTELQRLVSLTLMIWATETTANHGQWLGVYMCVSGVETYASALLLSMSPHRCLHLLLAGLSINSTGYLSSSRFAWLLTQVCVGLRTSPECVLCVCVCVWRTSSVTCSGLMMGPDRCAQRYMGGRAPLYTHVCMDECV